MADLEARFQTLVDRSGEHHLWLGAVDAHETPQMRVDGRLTTARRVAWILANGALPPGARIASCPDHPRCVRVDHLHLGSRPHPRLEQALPATARRRARPGTGTLRELRPAVWKLTVTIPGGGRVNRTVRGDAEQAERALALLAVEHRGGAETLDLLVDAHLAHLRQAGRTPETLRRYHQLWRDWLSPTLRHRKVDRLTRTDIEKGLAGMADTGQSDRSIHQAATVIASALAFARDHGDINHNPAIGAQLPDGTHLTTTRRRT